MEQNSEHHDPAADKEKCKQMKDRSIDHMAVVGHVQNRSPERMAVLTAVASITLASRAVLEACLQYENDAAAIPGILAAITYLCSQVIMYLAVAVEGMNVLHVKLLKSNNRNRLRAILHQIQEEIPSLASVADRLDRYHFPSDQDEK